MASATLAESRLSTPPKRVKDNAAGKTSSKSDGVNFGMVGIGRPRGTPPKWLATVSIGRCSNSAATEAPATAISIPGHAGRQFRSVKINAAEPTPTPKADGLKVGSA